MQESNVQLSVKSSLRPPVDHKVAGTGAVVVVVVIVVGRKQRTHVGGLGRGTHHSMGKPRLSSRPRWRRGTTRPHDTVGAAAGFRVGVDSGAALQGVALQLQPRNAGIEVGEALLQVLGVAAHRRQGRRQLGVVLEAADTPLLQRFEGCLSCLQLALCRTAGVRTT